MRQSRILLIGSIIEFIVAGIQYRGFGVTVIGLHSLGGVLGSLFFLGLGMFFTYVGMYFLGESIVENQKERLTK